MGAGLAALVGVDGGAGVLQADPRIVADTKRKRMRVLIAKQAPRRFFADSKAHTSRPRRNGQVEREAKASFRASYTAPVIDSVTDPTYYELVY